MRNEFPTRCSFIFLSEGGGGRREEHTTNSNLFIRQLIIVW